MKKNVKFSKEKEIIKVMKQILELKHMKIAVKNSVEGSTEDSMKKKE